MDPGAVVKPKKARVVKAKPKTKFKSEAKVKEEPSSPAAIQPESKIESGPRLPSTYASKADIEASAAAALQSYTSTANQEDAKLRVFDKEKAVTHGLTFLRKLVQRFEQQNGVFPELDGFKEEAESILALKDVPRILVGVLGYTGSGKSSLINALLDHELLLPCNAMRASTSVAVEVSYNRSDDPKSAYCAEIEFITKEEWIKEMEILQGDIKNRPEGEPLGGKSGSEASAAFAKVAAVYPDIDIEKMVNSTNPEVFLQSQDLSDILGKSRKIQEAKIKPFCSSINAYIDSKNSQKSAGQTAFWPLVKLVKIYVKAPVLKNGLVLVDLPGLGDSNAGRTNVTEGYIQKLQHIWVVADIVRAVDDQIAKDLLGHGRYHEDFVSFIMTKTDNINPDEVVESLGLGESALKNIIHQEDEVREAIEEAEERLDDLKQQVKDAKKGSKKRKHAELDHEDSENGPDGLDEQKQQDGRKPLMRLQKRVENETSQLNVKLAKLKVSMKTICVEERNEFTCGRLQDDFEGGLQELLQDMDEVGSGGSAITTKGKNALRTFCVSSKAYQKLKGRFKRDQNIDGFPTPGHTLIPQLQTFASKLTLRDRERIIDRFLTELYLLLLSLTAWAKETEATTQLSPEQRKELKQALEENFSIFEQACAKQINLTATNIRSSISRNIEKPLKESELVGWEQVVFEEEKIGYHTFKAVCRRGGVFQRSKEKCFNWNDAFLEVFLKPLTRPWNKVFQQAICKILQTFATNIIGKLQQFASAFRGSMTRITDTRYQPGHRALEKVRFLEEKLRGNAMIVLKDIKQKAEGSHRGIEPLIQEQMDPVYKSCLAETGKGTLKRMQRLLANHVEQKGNSMYKVAGAQLSKDLKKISTSVRPLLRAAIKEVLRFDKAIDQMIDGANPKEESLQLERARSAQQEFVLDHVNFLKAAWAHDVANHESQLRAANPFEHELVAKDDEEHDDSDVVDDSDSDSDTGSCGPNKNSDAEKSSDGESDDDLDKESDDEAEVSDDKKDEEEPSLFVTS